MNLEAVRQAVADTLTAAGYRARWYLPNNINPPCVLVAPNDDFIDYHEAFKGGLVRLEFKLMCIVPATSDRGGQDVLDSWLGGGTAETNTIIDVFHADQTLGGVVSSCVILGVQGYGPRIVAENPNFIGADVLLRVYTPRT